VASSQRANELPSIRSSPEQLGAIPRGQEVAQLGVGHGRERVGGRGLAQAVHALGVAGHLLAEAVEEGARARLFLT
jgi:hypothetical protein